jgi:glycosyltransferase involved in cell wall biosynthesis
MIEKMLNGDYGSDIQLCHVRMAFSKDMDEIGKFHIRKILELLSVILNIVRGRFKQGAKILYYPPAGPDKLAVLRDIAILGTTRWLFKRTIFHFHACGLTELYDSLPRLMQWLYRLAYSRPDVAICLSEFNPQDGKHLGAKREYTVPNGIEDTFEIYGNTNPSAHDKRDPQLLFVGVLYESKGVCLLLEACKILLERRVPFHLKVMGKFESPQFEREVKSLIEANGLADKVTFLGQLKGQKKFAAFASADIFCYPTFFESESFGVVAVEAMCFSLPVVATRWRGVQSVVDESRSGFLVPIKDAPALADKLEALIVDPELREVMGREGRKRYLEHFTVDKYHQRLRHIFEAVAKDLAEVDT